jgi:hypothetical protein
MNCRRLARLCERSLFQPMRRDRACEARAAIRRSPLRGSLFDFVNPVGADRRLWSFNRLSGDDEPGRKTFGPRAM